VLIEPCLDRFVLNRVVQNADESQQASQQIIKFLPVLFGFFSLNVPSGLGVYWVTNTLFSTIATLVIKSRVSDEPITCSNWQKAAFTFEIGAGCAGDGSCRHVHSHPPRLPPDEIDFNTHSEGGRGYRFAHNGTNNFVHTAVQASP
jgi:hypothetical protein